MTNTPKILVVDDEAILREMIDVMLTHNGYSVTTCKNGRECIKHFISGNYDLILTDMKMPEMSGLSLARNIRKMDRNIPIALVSASLPANGDAEDAGIDMLLAKPFTFQQLSCLVSDAMKLRRVRQV